MRDVRHYPRTHLAPSGPAARFGPVQLVGRRAEPVRYAYLLAATTREG